MKELVKIKKKQTKKKKKKKKKKTVGYCLAVKKMLRNVILDVFLPLSLPCICVIISHLCIYVMTMSCICLSRNKIMLCYVMLSFKK